MVDVACRRIWKDEPQAFDIEAFEMRARLVEFVLLARGDGHARAHLAQRFGHLQTDPARAAGDQRHPPFERLVDDRHQVTAWARVSTANLLKMVARW